MIVKAALLLFRDNQHNKELLFVRAKGRPYFIFPGGKQEADETIEEALQRELREELGTKASNVSALGVIVGHTPDGRPLEMHLYTGVLISEPYPMAEIEEMIWMTKKLVSTNGDSMTPMTRDHVLPFLAKHHIW